MKVGNLIGERFKEKPADAAIKSHSLMVRGGYIKQMANGVFSSYTVLCRIVKKIEQIIREEMEAIDGQEVLFPIAMSDFLERKIAFSEQTPDDEYPKILDEPNENIAVHMFREYGQSYAKYPFMVFQNQSLLCDEGRYWGGLMCTHEYTINDAYSFHASEEDLENYYNRCLSAYQRVFSRMGITEITPVSSGNTSHEFVLFSSVGKDSFVICNSCDYQANLESAEGIFINQDNNSEKALLKVHTPNCKTIEEVCEFLKIPNYHLCKAVVYQNTAEEYVVVFIRGDLDVNVAKLENYMGEKIYPATITEDGGIVAGYIGPCGLKNAKILFDKSLCGLKNLCCGANEHSYHYTGFQIERDFGKIKYHDFATVIDGGICPCCNNSSLGITQGIEVAHIRQLGDKCTKAIDMTFIGENGVSHFPVVGNYRIGISRLAAIICELRHDKYGPIWPITIAPWQIHVCCVRADDVDVKEYADKLYSQLQAENFEVIYDDRPVSAGVMFSDADLLGIPFRIIVSPRNMKEGCCEIMSRDKTVQKKIGLNEVITTIEKMVKDALREVEG